MATDGSADTPFSIRQLYRDGNDENNTNSLLRKEEKNVAATKKMVRVGSETRRTKMKCLWISY